MAALLTALPVCGCAAAAPQAHRPTSTPSPRATPTAVPTPTPTPDPLAGMTLQQEVSQLFMVGFVGQSLTPEPQQTLGTYRFGAVVLDDGDNNGASGPRWRSWSAASAAPRDPGRRRW